MLVVNAQDLATPCKGNDDCCDGILCGINEGDCDSHENCAGHLRCGVDNCIGPDFDSTDDCCWEDPLFPSVPDVSTDGRTCSTVQNHINIIGQAAVSHGCQLPKTWKGQGASISMNQCAQISCSAKLIGESFTCNNNAKPQTCNELTTLLDALVKMESLLCPPKKSMLRGSCVDWANINWANTHWAGFTPTSPWCYTLALATGTTYNSIAYNTDDHSYYPKKACNSNACKYWGACYTSDAAAADTTVEKCCQGCLSQLAASNNAVADGCWIFAQADSSTATKCCAYNDDMATTFSTVCP